MPLDYDMPLYRPPSEAYAAIIQATLGCSWNKCRFCLMYKSKRYRVRPQTEIVADIERMAVVYPQAPRVFLADGDALAMPFEPLLELVQLSRRRFGRAKSINIYASPQSVRTKTDEQLVRLREAGLGIAYYGIESGDETVLELVHKGAGRAELLKQALRLKRAGLAVSATVILGLGGVEHSWRHIAETARFCSELEPDYLGALTLMLGPFEDTYRRVVPGWEPIDKRRTLEEVRELVEGIEGQTIVFRTNHASNWLPLKGVLSRDRQPLLQLIDKALADPHSPLLRPDEWRAL